MVQNSGCDILMVYSQDIYCSKKPDYSPKEWRRMESGETKHVSRGIEGQEPKSGGVV